MGEDKAGIAKVLGVSKLRNNYKPHEAKRKLCDSYDLFLADERVIPVLPKLLGKTFFKTTKSRNGRLSKNWTESVITTKLH